jgi:hypothetical protein
VARERNYRQENLASRYGITVDEYEQQLRRQNGKCPICLNDFIIGIEEHRSSRSPVIDHDHDTFAHYLRYPTWQCTGQMELDLFGESVTT